MTEVKMNHFTGRCAQCRIDNKPLPICRDDHFICAGCDEEIRLSLEQENPVDCVGCHRQYSWLWGAFDEQVGFRCRGCLPGGLCHLCLKKYATHILQAPDTFYFACADCAAAAAAAEV